MRNDSLLFSQIPASGAADQPNSCANTAVNPEAVSMETTVVKNAAASLSPSASRRRQQQQMSPRRASARKLRQHNLMAMAQNNQNQVRFSPPHLPAAFEFVRWCLASSYSG